MDEGDSLQSLHSDYPLAIHPPGAVHTALDHEAYRINWHISPPYVARARQMPSLRGGLIAKGFTM